MNLISRAYALLFSEYKNSLALFSQLEGHISPLNTLEQQYENLLNPCNIDAAFGEGLDIIGWLIGLPRFAIQLPTQVFQFDVTPFDEGYHFGDNSWINYNFVTDEQYRGAIRSFILVRNSLGNTDDLIVSLAYLLGVENSDIIVSPQDCVTVNVLVNKHLGITENSLLHYIAPNGSNLWAKLAGYTYNITGI